MISQHAVYELDKRNSCFPLLCIRLTNTNLCMRMTGV